MIRKNGTPLEDAFLRFDSNTLLGKSEDARTQMIMESIKAKNEKPVDVVNLSMNIGKDTVKTGEIKFNETIVE